MKTLPKPAIVALLAAMLLAGGLNIRQARADNPAPAPTQLAVINIVQVFSEIDEKKDGDSEIEKLSADINADRKKREDQINKLADDLKPGGVFSVNSPEYKKLEDEWLEDTMNYKAFISVSEQRLLMKQRIKTADLYRKINLAVEKYAKAKGIALVFVINDVNYDVTDVRDLQAQITTRKVLYANPSFDITKDIKEMMNADYRMGSKNQ